MANASKRFFGEVGYEINTVDDTGVARTELVKRDYYGDVLELSTKWQSTENMHDDIRTSHRISILADPYAIQNFPFIKYVKWMDIRWEVKTIRVEYPRLILSLGGVYNGPQT